MTMERDSLVARLLKHRKTLSVVLLENFSSNERHKAVADACASMHEAAAALSRPEQVVKALEWRYIPDAFPPMWITKTTIGSYHIEETSGSDSPSYDVINPMAGLMVSTEGLPEAKAAAQADFESRIRSCLTTAAPLQADASAPASPAIGVQAVKAREAMRHSKSLLTDLRIGQGIQNERFPDNKIEGALWDAIPSVVAELDAALAALSQEPVPATAEERAAPTQQPVAWRWRVNYRDDWCWSATKPEFSSSDLSRGMVSDVHPLYDHPSSEPELRAEIVRLTRERDEALSRVEELEAEAETVSAEFEGDCWKALRSLLSECNFDWRDVEPDGVTADDAREHISTTLDELEKGETRNRERAEAAESRVEALSAALDEEIQAYSDPRHDCHTNRAALIALNHVRSRAALDKGAPR